MSEAHEALYIHDLGSRSLAEILGERRATVAANGEALALVYTAGRCALARVTLDGSLDFGPAQTVELDSIYEARVFGPGGELRWRHPGGGEPAAMALMVAPLPSAPCLELPPIVGTLRQSYLLWGEGTDVPTTQGWSWLGAARIGTMAVPLVGIARRGRACLRTVEYLCRYQHGNVAVAEERLVGLEADHGDR